MSENGCFVFVFVFVFVFGPRKNSLEIQRDEMGYLSELCVLSQLGESQHDMTQPEMLQNIMQRH